MTLLERALYFFSTTQQPASDIELLNISDIVESVSRNSNDWNKAAVLLAAEHEQSPGKRAAVVCYPASTVGHSIDFPLKTTSEWNALALALLEKTERNYKENSNPSFQGTLRDKAAHRP